MASSGNTPIQLYYSNTSGNVPVSANLIIGELAINVLDKLLFTEDSSGNVYVLADGNARAKAAFTQANTDVTSISITAGTYGNASNSYQTKSMVYGFKFN